MNLLRQNDTITEYYLITSTSPKKIASFGESTAPRLISVSREAKKISISAQISFTAVT